MFSLKSSHGISCNKSFHTDVLLLVSRDTNLKFEVLPLNTAKHLSLSVSSWQQRAFQSSKIFSYDKDELDFKISHKDVAFARVS